MDSRLEDGDWEHIFSNYALPVHVKTKLSRSGSYLIAEVIEVIALEDGQNDGDEWVGLFKMGDGKFLTIRAGCDYTGWGCQEGGSSDYADTLPDAIAFGLTQTERHRLLYANDDVNNGAI